MKFTLACVFNLHIKQLAKLLGISRCSMIISEETSLCANILSAVSRWPSTWKVDSEKSFPVKLNLKSLRMWKVNLCHCMKLETATFIIANLHIFAPITIFFLALMFSSVARMSVYDLKCESHSKLSNTFFSFSYTFTAGDASTYALFLVFLANVVASIKCIIGISKVRDFV